MDEPRLVAVVRHKSGRFTRHLVKDEQRFVAPPDAVDVWIAREPSIEELAWEVVNDGVCEAVDGCPVEPDGICPHGAPSWHLVMGII